MCRFTAISCVLMLVGLSACGGDAHIGGESPPPQAPPPASPTTPGAEPTPALPLLHATTGGAAGIYDEDGRQVLLRSVNYSALGDYYQDHPDHPSVIPPREDDLAQMASLGILGIRLLMSWSKIEPEPGVYSSQYLDRIEGVVEAAAAQGLYVVLDMHQDAWGKHIATRETGESCLPPLEPAIGWDGAPAWATHTGGLSTCRLGQRELAPAVAQAFTNFYANSFAIQNHFIASWQQVVERLARHSNIAGYDLFNEPHPGYLPAVNGATVLGAFYAQLIEAIRGSEQRVQSPEHIIFFEPSIEWSLTGLTPIPPPSFTSERNIVFAPHNYCGSISPLPMRSCFQNSENMAATYNATFWAGEWGFFGDPTEFASQVEEFAALEDEFLVSGAIWQWAQACGDPHTIGTPGNEPPEQTIHVREIGCPGDIDHGFVEANARVLRRPYPRRTPGRLVTLQSGVADNTMLLEADSAHAGKAEIWVPGNEIPVVSASFAGTLELQHKFGGFVVLVDTPTGTYQIGINEPEPEGVQLTPLIERALP